MYLVGTNWNYTADYLDTFWCKNYTETFFSNHLVTGGMCAVKSFIYALTLDIAFIKNIQLANK